jgi:steroid delta-isomerase-like uncharacterized protein
LLQAAEPGTYATSYRELVRLRTQTTPLRATTLTYKVQIMSAESNNLLMSRFVKFINTADELLAEELVDAKAIFHAPVSPTPLVGPNGYMEILGVMRSGFPDVQWTLEEMIAENDMIAARFIMRGTHQATFFGVPASGKTIQVQAMNFYRFSNGKIIEERGQPDLLTLLQQIGAVPA